MEDCQQTIDSSNHLALEGQTSEAEYFFFDTCPEEKQNLSIMFGGFEKCAPAFEINRESFPYYVIEIPTKGRCSLEIEGNQYELKKGSLGGFSPGIPHHYKCDKNDPVEHIFIAFSGSEASDLFKQSSLSKNNVIPLKRPSYSLFLAESILNKGLEKTEFSHQLCCVYLKALFLEQSSGLVPSGHSDALAMNRYWKCRKYIDENYSSILSVAGVASTCSIDIRYMSRLFKKYADITPHKYIMQLKLSEAANLLLTTNLSVSEIGYLVGFEDPYHFSRNFKNLYSLSPLHYRKAHL
jgi:AraC-like DNA-binding protein